MKRAVVVLRVNHELAAGVEADDHVELREHVAGHLRAYVSGRHIHDARRAVSCLHQDELVVGRGDRERDGLAGEELSTRQQVVDLELVCVVGPLQGHRERAQRREPHQDVSTRNHVE